MWEIHRHALVSETAVGLGVLALDGVNNRLLLLKSTGGVLGPLASHRNGGPGGGEDGGSVIRRGALGGGDGGGLAVDGHRRRAGTRGSPNSRVGREVGKTKRQKLRTKQGGIRQGKRWKGSRGRRRWRSEQERHRERRRCRGTGGRKEEGSLPRAPVLGVVPRAGAAKWAPHTRAPEPIGRTTVRGRAAARGPTEEGRAQQEGRWRRRPQPGDALAAHQHGGAEDRGGGRWASGGGDQNHGTPWRRADGDGRARSPGAR
jgi:hypothetical protein